MSSARSTRASYARPSGFADEGWAINVNRGDGVVEATMPRADGEAPVTRSPWWRPSSASERGGSRP